MELSSLFEREQTPAPPTEGLDVERPLELLLVIGSWQKSYPLAQVLRALEWLPEAYRVVVHLHCIRKGSYAEIARLLGRPMGTVKCQVHRGKELLQWILEHEPAEWGEKAWFVRGQISHEAFAYLAARIEKLPRPYRMIMKMRYLEGCSYSEMVLLLGKCKNTVKSLVRRGKDLLFEGCSTLCIECFTSLHSAEQGRSEPAPETSPFCLLKYLLREGGQRSVL